MRLNNTAIGVTALTALMVMGCSNEKSTTTNTPAGFNQSREIQADAPEPTVTKDDDDGSSGSIHVDDEIARLCDMPTAHFGFDRANVQAEARGALDALAKCLTDGKLAGRELVIVGHADPRGTTEYNFALGQRRAGSVAQYLQQKGIESSKLETTSRGELDASGTDIASWARDRKVEIHLAPADERTSSR